MQKSFSSITRARTSLVQVACALSLSLLASPLAYGQAVNGTWLTGGAVDTSWSNAANWVGGKVANGGGTASLPEADPIGLFRPLTLNSGFTATVSQLVIDSGIAWQISSVATGTLNFAAGGATLDIRRSPATAPDSGASGHLLAARLTGAAITKTGPGSIILSAGVSATNSYVGGTTVSQGFIYVQGGDSLLGSTASGNDITLGGGGLGAGSPLNTARNVTVTSSGGILRPFSLMTFAGPVSGSGRLTRDAGQSDLTFVAANPFTGTLVNAGGSLVVSGSGSFASAISFDFSGTIVVDNSAVNLSNRLSDGAPMISRGASFRMTNSGTGTVSSETVGSLTLDSGDTSIVLAPAGPGSSTAFTAASLSRANHAELFIRGIQGSNTVSVLANPGGLIGGGGGAGSTNISVLPWAIGSADSAGVAASLLTYDTTTKLLRPLDLTTEYASNLAANADANVRLSIPATVPGGGKTVNALVLEGAGVNGAAALTIAAGALLTSLGPVEVQSPLIFPAGVEGIFHTTTDLVTSGPISGTAGITKSGNGTWTIAGAGLSSSFSGSTTINAGRLSISGDLPLGAPSALGQGSDAIVISPGGGTSADAQLFFSSSSLIARPISVRGAGSAAASIGSSASAVSLSFSGSLDLSRELRLDLAAGTAATFTGPVTGAGRLTDASTGTVSLTASNSFSGGVEIHTASYQAGNDRAFGTGTIWFAGPGYLRSVPGSGPRTLDNPMVVVGSTMNVGGTDAITLSGPLDLGGLATVTAAGNVTLSGPINYGSIVKSGPGNLTLTGSNGYRGTTTVTAGVLQVGNGGTSGSLGAASITVAAAGSLVLNRSGPFTLSNAISGAGTLTQAGSGIVTLTGANSTSGPVYITSGQLQVGSGGQTGSLGTGTVFNSGVLTFSRSNNVTFAGTLTGTGGLVVAGTGVVSLANNSNSYLGTTSITFGTLVVNGNVLSDGVTPSPLGLATTPIVLDASSNFDSHFWAGSNLTVNRPLVVSGAGTGLTGIGNLTGPETVTFNGDISLQRTLRLEFDASPQATINSTISGPGGLTDGFGSGQILTASNSFSGGIKIITGHYVAANDYAFGSGAITSVGFTQTSFGTISATGSSRLLRNPIVLHAPLLLAGSTPLEMSGAVDLSGETFAFVVSNTATTTLSGPITNGGLTKSGPGTLVISGPLSYTGNTTGSGPLVIQSSLRTPASALSITGANSATSLSAAATPIVSGTFRVAGEFAAISVAATGKVSLPATNRSLSNPTVLITTSLSIASTGFVDLGTSDLIVHNAGVPALRTLVATWYNGGAPLQIGLGTRSAAPYTSLAVFSNARPDGPAFFSTYDGVALTPADAIVKYTYLGDTNLDGVLDGRDMANVIEGFSTGASGWQNGDVNYTGGPVDLSDLTAFFAAYNYFNNTPGLPSLGNGAGSAALDGAVPEPAQVLPMLLGLSLLHRRRR